MFSPFEADVDYGTQIYALRSTTSPKRKRKIPATALLENKRYKQSSEGAGPPGPQKEVNVTSGRTIKTTKAVSFTKPRGLSISDLRDGHRNKGSNPPSKSTSSRQTPARNLQASSNEVRISDGSQARLVDQQNSKTRLQEEEKRTLKFAYPHIDEIVFFKSAFGFSKPTSVLVQKVWEKAVREESESLGEQCPIHIPKASHAVGKEVCILSI